MSFRDLFAGAVVLVGGAVASCSNNPVPPCPDVRVDSSTARLVQFKDGAGRNPGDVAYEVQLVGFEGECDHSEESVDVVMNVVLEVVAGPAASSGRISVPYFVAVPQFYPQAEGKRLFTVSTDVPNRAAGRKRIEEKNVRVTIPLKKGEPAGAYDVYLGLQLTPEQLDYNRSRR